MTNGGDSAGQDVSSYAVPVDRCCAREIRIARGGRLELRSQRIQGRGDGHGHLKIVKKLHFGDGLMVKPLSDSVADEWAGQGISNDQCA